MADHPLKSRRLHMPPDRGKLDTTAPRIVKRHRWPSAALRAQYETSSTCSMDTRLISAIKRGRECHSFLGSNIS